METVSVNYLYPGSNTKKLLAFSLGLLGVGSLLSSYKIYKKDWDVNVDISFKKKVAEPIARPTVIRENLSARTSYASPVKENVSYQPVEEVKEEVIETPIEKVDSVFPELPATAIIEPVVKSISYTEDVEWVEDKIEEERPYDVLDDVATNRGHVLLACRTESGKTSTILGLIDRINTYTNGQAEFGISDPKDSYWMGLEDLKEVDGSDRVVRLDVDNPSTIQRLFKKIEFVRKKRRLRAQLRNQCRKENKEYNPTPYFFIIDEWATTLHELAEKYDLQNDLKGSKSLYNQLISEVQTLIRICAEDKIYIWLVTQSHQANQCDLETGLRDNLGVFCQGRKGNFQSIERALSDNWLIPNNSLRKELNTKFQEYKTLDSDIPVVYTNMGGHKVSFMPDLTDIKSKKIFAKIDVNDDDINWQDVINDDNSEEF